MSIWLILHAFWQLCSTGCVCVCVCEREGRKLSIGMNMYINIMWGRRGVWVYMAREKIKYRDEHVYKYYVGEGWGVGVYGTLDLEQYLAGAPRVKVTRDQ